MYRLQIMVGGFWKWGTVTYDSLMDAHDKLDKLARAGIQARIRNNSEFTEA